MKQLTKKTIELLAGLAAAADQTKADVLLGPMFQNSGLTTEEIVRKAENGDRSAHLFLCNQAGGALAQSQPLPRVLEAYAAKVLLDEFNEAKRGKGHPTEWMKNYAVVHALGLLDLEGIPPTRSEATDYEIECGSRIVAEIFTDAGVEIGEAGWQRFGRGIALKSWPLATPLPYNKNSSISVVLHRQTVCVSRSLVVTQNEANDERSKLHTPRAQLHGR